MPEAEKKGPLFVATELVPAPLTETAPQKPLTLRERLRAFLRPLHRDPVRAITVAEDEAILDERRKQLLNELSNAVADAPDDEPIQETIRRLNRHFDD